MLYAHRIYTYVSHAHFDETTTPFVKITPLLLGWSREMIIHKPQKIEELTLASLSLYVCALVSWSPLINFSLPLTMLFRLLANCRSCHGTKLTNQLA
jgi:hypothetical protein